MSRRDTIIIAVLVNAGLMALLFMLAINTEEERTFDKVEYSQPVAESRLILHTETKSPVPIVLNDQNGPDEVDAFLKDLVITEYAPGMSYEESFIEVEKTPMAIARSENSPLALKQEDTSARFVEITVKRGDALEKIARHNGTTVDAIKKANHLTSSKLSIGQVLRVPLSQKASGQELPVAEVPKPAAKTPVIEQKSPAAEPQYYTIKSGDNPWKIAKQFQVRFDDLLKLNDLDEDKARNLKVGDKIRVR